MRKNEETLQEKWLKKFGAEHVYNRHCVHLQEDFTCKLKMDMMFCSNKCAYATNQKLTNTTDRYRKVNGIRHE